MTSHQDTGGKKPKILVFSTNTISDPGIDLAGSSHMDYPTNVLVLAVPCSSGINPGWVLHALQSGFKGVFIAADGTDCAFLPDCTDRTAKVVQQAQELIADDAPMVPLVHSRPVLATTNAVENYVPHPSTSESLAEVELAN